jgi:hypothetical protein
MATNKKVALTYWNRLEPRPRSPEIARSLAACVRDPLWMLTRQWQFGEFRGEDAGSPAYVQMAARTAPFLGWRPSDGNGAWRPIERPLEDEVATEGFTLDLATRVELGQAFASALQAQGLSAAEYAGVLSALGDAFPLRDDEILPADAAARRFHDLCAERVIDGGDLYLAYRAGAALPADQVLIDNTSAIDAALAMLAEDVEATLGAVGRADAPAWNPHTLQYEADVAVALPSGGAAVLRADPDRDATFEWFAFDLLRRDDTVAVDEDAITKRRASYLPMHVRFKGMPNRRWWDFERGTTDFGAIKPDRRDLAKLLVMDFMLIHGNDYFVVPLNLPTGSVTAIDELLVHDVFGGITDVQHADRAEASPAARWSCFTLASTASGAAPTSLFLLPPSAGASRISSDALEDVRFVRDEQANYVWAIEHATENGIGLAWLGHERSVAQSAGEPKPVEPVTTAALRYRLQSFVPRHWLPLIPVSLDPLAGETAFELGRMVRPDGSVPEPAGRVLTPEGLNPYRVREEVVPRTGARVVREPIRTRWLAGETLLWTARRTLVGRGEGSSGLAYDTAVAKPPTA